LKGVVQLRTPKSSMSTPDTKLCINMGIQAAIKDTSSDIKVVELP